MKIIIDTVKKTIDEQRTEADIGKKEFDLQVDILSGIGMALQENYLSFARTIPNGSEVL